MDTIGIRIVKRLFSLPTTSPNVSIVHTFGLLYITQAIDQKRFVHLHKILNRPETKQIHKVFRILKTMNIGWAKNILEKLKEYNLEDDLEKIKQFTPNEWKEKVRVAVLKKNGEKLIKNCLATTENGSKVLTKTKHIHDTLISCKYSAKPLDCIIGANKQRTRTIFLSQNCMLECGKNMKGTISEICKDCQILDDESHRLNNCKKWAVRDSNRGNLNFQDVYDDNIDVVNNIVDEIEKVWETKFANGRMKRDT